jgi:hypothetical protein
VVTAAAIIAMIMSALTGLVWLLFGIFAVASGDSLVEAIRDDADLRRQFDDAGVSMTELADYIQTSGFVVLVPRGAHPAHHPSCGGRAPGEATRREWCSSSWRASRC